MLGANWIIRTTLIGAIVLTPKRAPTPSVALDEFTNFRASVHYYTIEGQSAEELHRSMSRRGPVDIYGIKRFAECRWKVWWDWPDERNISNVKVYGRANLTYPRWDTSQREDSALSDRWDTFLAAIKTHEKRHLFHLTSHMPQISLKIKEASRANPALTRKQANKIAQSVLRDIRTLDKEYDKRSKNGKLEGVDLLAEH